MASTRQSCWPSATCAKSFDPGRSPGDLWSMTAVRHKKIDGLFIFYFETQWAEAAATHRRSS